MARPTLIIGVGGTGQWVLAHIKKNLLDAYGKVPEGVWLLSLDTTVSSNVSVGGWGKSQSIQAGSGTIDLSNEHVFVGGDASKYAADIRNGKHSCVESWLDASWLMNLPSGKSLLNIQMGAGRFRPVGRLAVFHSLSQGRNSILKNALERAIVQIRKQIQGQSSLYVCLTGSFAGGTGSGMFADIAHIVRSLADIHGTKAKIRGYFVLPQAFDGTVSIGTEQRSDLIAKSFAAMRETARFAATFEYAEGYPMFYECGNGSNDPLMQRHVNSTLFELLYYFDGKRDRNPLEQVEIENGVTPTIAEAILAMVDEQAGHTLEEHAVNVDSDRLALNVTSDTVTVGSIGAYTWVFPIYDIIENWTYTLARDVLRLFLQPRGEPDPRTSALEGLQEDRAGGRDSQYGEEAATSFWDTSHLSTYKMGALPRDIGRAIGYQALQGDQARKAIVDKVHKRTLDEWLVSLAPQRGEEEDFDESQRNEIENITDKFLHPQKKNAVGGFMGIGAQYDNAQVPTTDTIKEREEKRDPRLGAERIHKAVTRFFDEHLGPLQNGKRAGGEYSDALKKYADWQVERFQNTIRQFISDTLNGTEADNADYAVANKAGKLGYVNALLKAMANQFDGARRVMEDARIAKQRSAKRPEEEKLRSTIYDEMKKRTGKQENYLEVCQRLLELERWDVAARTASEAAERMYNYIAAIRQALDAWVGVIATERQGIYAMVHSGRKQIQTDRGTTDALSHVRNVIYDPDYEDRRYRYYTESRRDEVAQVLNDLFWEVSYTQMRDPETRELRSVPTVNLKIRNVPKDEDGRREFPLSTQPHQSNVDLLLKRCRAVFADARETESISAYLLDKYDGTSTETAPEMLADEIYNKNGPLLEYGGRGGAPYNYLRVHKKPDLTGQEQFLGRVLNRLAERNNAPTKAAHILDSTDPFRMTFLYHAEVIDLKELAAYSEGRQEYRKLTDVARRKNHHIFPAERNAVMYESSEELANQILPHRIVLLLENLDMFNLAVLSWLYGRGDGNKPAQLINQYTYDDATGQRCTVWRLSIPPEEGEFDELGDPKRAEHYFLTNPDKDPLLLDALETFCVGKKARAYMLEGGNIETAVGVGNGEDIPHKQVNDRLLSAYDADRARRINAGILGTSASEFQAKLNSTSGEALPRIQMLVSQFETSKERIDQLKATESQEDQKSPDKPLYPLIKTHLMTWMKDIRKEINR